MTDDAARWKRAKEAAKRGLHRGRQIVEKITTRPVGLALRRYLKANGNVLAGGIAYYSLASIAAALVLAVTIASYVVIGNEELRNAVIDFVADAIPGIFSQPGEEGLIDPGALRPTPMSGLVGLVAFGVLIFTATRYMRGMRAAARTMLGGAASKAIPGALRDVIALVSLGLVAVVGAALQVVAGALANSIAGLLGDGGTSPVTVRVVAALFGLVANSAFVAIVLLVLGGAKAAARIVVPTIVATAVVIAVLQLASGYFVASASSNTVLAPFATVIALLLFVDFTSRVLLVAAAWIGAVAGGISPSAEAVELPPHSRRSRKSVTTRRATGRKKAG